MMKKKAKFRSQKTKTLISIKLWYVFELIYKNAIKKV